MCRFGSIEEYALAFADALRSLSGKATTLVECAQLLSDLALNRQMLIAAIRRQLAVIALRPNEAVNTEAGEIMLHKGDGFYFAVAIYDSTSPKDLFNLVAHAFLVSLNNETIDFDLYQLPSDWQEDVYVSDTRLTPLGSRSIAPGEVAIFGDVNLVPDFKIVRRNVILKLIVPQGIAYGWTFERDTLRSIGIAASNYQDTNKVHIAEMLGQMGSATSVEPLTKLAQHHPRHFVRWAAVQALAAIDADVAKPLVHRALQDPHPHIRESAKQASLILAT